MCYFVLIGPFIKYIQSQAVCVTMIFPDVSPRKYWWPLVNSLSIDRFKTASREDLNVILFAPKTKVGWHTKPLLWDLYAFRFNFNYPFVLRRGSSPKDLEADS